MEFSFQSFTESTPGPIWQRHFNSLWPAYRRWFLRYGEADRPSYLESSSAIKRHMPEFFPVYENMVDLAGGGDHAARFLSQYCPPPLFRGCSQAICLSDQAVMTRSYDYSPYVFDGLLMRSKFGSRQVIGMMDCMSGLLDGINDDGLAVSMSFGGREDYSAGFGISLVLRYLLESAGNVAEARELLDRLPVQGAYNVMLFDADLNYVTVVLSPGQQPRYLDDRVATNHQSDSSWPIYEEKVLTHQRQQYLSNMISQVGLSAAEFNAQFLQAPLFHNQYGKGFGTLYDAAFYPQLKSCEYFWPGLNWVMDFNNFTDRSITVQFYDPAGYPSNLQAYDEIYTAHPLPVLQF
jgi:predicted choloylglycine hydrolase